MAIKLVVFDMAGTTVDDKDYVSEALAKGFEKYGYEITVADANSVMGIPKPVAIRTLLDEKFDEKDKDGKLTEKIHKVFVDEMINFYKTDPSVKSKKNAEDVFKQLRAKGILVGINTGFSRDIADTIMDRLEWKKKNLIDHSVTSDEVPQGRPYPDMIFKAMKDLRIISRNEVAKVGDTSSDLKEGMAAGCKYVIGITTGAYKKEELEREKHTHLVDDLTQVVEIVGK